MEDKKNNDAFVQVVLDMAVQSKKMAKCLFVITLSLVGLLFGVIVAFLIWSSQYEYEATETKTITTTVEQHTEDGEGNNIYQSGESATYNEAGVE